MRRAPHTSRARVTSLRGLSLATAVLCTGLAFAQSAGGDFALTREAIAGGGSRAIGGSYTSINTTGQAAPGRLTGGAFVLGGGFQTPMPRAQAIFADGFEE